MLIIAITEETAMNTFLPKVLAALAVGALLSASPSLAATNEVNEPWCSIDADEAMNCSYRTMQDCETVIRPEGGECMPNPRSNFVPPKGRDD
jgi:hypothetical protein